MSSISFPVILIVFAIAILAVTPRFDRKRIRKNIEDHGGKVIEISGVWTWGRNDRAYDVSYLTAWGKRVCATCRTNIWRGVYWVNDRPPGLFSDESMPDDLSIGYGAEEPSGPAEPVQCLGCGNIIPANEASCLQCGWSYRAHPGK